MEKITYEEIYSDNTLNLIKNEFSRLNDVAYLDHTGATLYAASQARAVCDELCGNVFGNPHALNSSSKLSSDIVEQVRERVLSHFKTDSNHYDVIFTSGATASLKLVAETFNFTSESRFLYLTENHTSVLGMRELAAKNNANILPLTKTEAYDIIEHKSKVLNIKGGPNLFVYPAQCNFSGLKYPLSWVSEGVLGNNTAVMLDAASFVATSELDLSSVTPDFVCISFYKMFGLPTGLGALLIKHGSERFLNKVYFGGGTVLMAMSDQRRHVNRSNLHDRFEDGTISYLSIASLRHGFDTLLKIVPGGMADIERHTYLLAKYLHDSLASLRHANDKPVVVLYCDTNFERQDKQGPVVNFNLLRADGSYIGFSEVLHMCNLFDVHVRTGCFCNPGACQRHLGLTSQQLQEHFEAGHVCGDSVDLISGQPTGSVRASLGYCSTLQHVQALINLIKKCFVETVERKVTLQSVVTSGDMKLSHIFVYPVKSCGAQSVLSWPLDSKGFVGDRVWMIATDAGVALTQKHVPRMCLIKPCLDLEAGILTLTFPGMDNISIDYASSVQSDSATGSKVCGVRVQTSDCGDQIAEWLSLALEKSGLRLLRQYHLDHRTNKKSNTELSLANQAQFLLVNVSSLAWLEQRVVERQNNEETQEEGEEVTCEGDELLARFRSNLVISGAPEFEETKWKALKIGSILLKAEGPCTRCQMICISQSSGTKTTEPLRTLTSSLQGRMQFGAYFSHSMQVTSRKLYVGSPVTIVNLQN